MGVTEGVIDARFVLVKVIRVESVLVISDENESDGLGVAEDESVLSTDEEAVCVRLDDMDSELVVVKLDDGDTDVACEPVHDMVDDQVSEDVAVAVAVFICEPEVDSECEGVDDFEVLRDADTS